MGWPLQRHADREQLHSHIHTHTHRALLHPHQRRWCRMTLSYDARQSSTKTWPAPVKAAIHQFSHTLLALKSGKKKEIFREKMGWKAFLEGGLASVVAGITTHPLDLIKVRMQLQMEPSAAMRPVLALAGQGHRGQLPPAVCSRAGPISVGVKVFQMEGAQALFSGVSAAVLRQGVYSTTRLGLYDMLKRRWQDPLVQGGGLSLPKKIAAALVAGGVGAALGNPADVAMVRMQADGRLPLHQRRNYRSVGDALARMVKQEGVVSLWTGSGPTVQRAMLVTAAQLASYDQIKESLISNNITRDGFGTQVAASCCAGFISSVVTNPIDVIKTRIMNMKVEAGKEASYKGSLDCAVKTVRSEGPMALYKGFVPTATRQGPFAVVLFLTLEQIRALLK